MKTIVFVCQKGGVGKTTLCSNLALVAQASNKTVVLIDTDKQGSLSSWYNNRTREDVNFIEVNARNLEEKLTALASKGVDYTFIDTSGAASAELPLILSNADYVLVPVQARRKDFLALEPTLELINTSGKPFSFVLNLVDNREAGVVTALKELAKVSTVAGTISRSVKFEHADQESLGMIEYEPNGIISQQLKDLWKSVKAYADKTTKDLKKAS